MLAEYKNDLFATHADMNAALRYITTLCVAATSSADSIAVRTAAHTILNTAIELHRAERQVLVDKINELSTRKDPVTALLTLVQEQVAKAIAEQPLDEQIENWMADNLQDHVEKCIDVQEKIENYVENHLELEETIYEQISSYFGNNTFSIEPR